MLLWRLIVLCVLLCKCAIFAIKPKTGFHFLSSDGTIARSRLFTNFTETFSFGGIGKSFIGVLNLDNQGGANCANEMFHTNFSSSLRGISLSMISSRSISCYSQA